MEGWINSIEDHFALAEIPKDKQGKYIGCYLEGNPLNTYRQASIEIEDKQNPAKLFELLREKHGDAWQDMTNTDMAIARKQAIGESVLDN